MADGRAGRNVKIIELRKEPKPEDFRSAPTGTRSRGGSWEWIRDPVMAARRAPGPASDPRPDGYWRLIVDWHADAYWPTLLREITEPHLWWNPNTTWTCEFSFMKGQEVDFDFANEPTDADAVCAAWIKWASRTDRSL